MNQIFSRLSTRSWLFHVTWLSFVLGALLAANLNTQGSIRRQLGVVGSARLPWLVESLKEQRDLSQNLKRTITELRAQASQYEEELSKSGKQAHSLNGELQDLKFLVGLTPVHGPGVTITLEDNKQKKIGDNEADLYIVHDFDLRNVVNELLAGGAEAISINEHRLVSRSAIRCVGPAVMINGEPTGGPFVVRAIGSPSDLDSALNMRDGILDVLRLGIRVSFARSDNVEIPAFSGPTNVKYAKPLPLQAGKE